MMFIRRLSSVLLPPEVATVLSSNTFVKSSYHDYAKESQNNKVKVKLTAAKNKIESQGNFRE